MVYVEFLFAFFPLLFLFLAVCQLSLAVSAEVLVSQAANQGARAAIVVLEEDPERYDDISRGDLSGGEPAEDGALSALSEALGLNGITDLGSPGGEQHGARMAPIRAAAYTPLLPLAPNTSAYRTTSKHSLEKAVRAGWLESLHFALMYTRGATAVSLVTGPGSDNLVTGKVTTNANITVRVTYAFHCSVPLVRVFLCRSAADVTALDRELMVENASGKVGVLKQVEVPDFLVQAPLATRFLVLSSEVTLPNQGAGYY